METKVVETTFGSMTSQVDEWAKGSMMKWEQRQLIFQVTCCAGIAVIRDAAYVLYRGQDITGQGPCSINGGRLVISVNPREIGIYRLTITYTVAPNTRKARFLFIRWVMWSRCPAAMPPPRIRSRKPSFPGFWQCFLLNNSLLNFFDGSQFHFKRVF